MNHCTVPQTYISTLRRTNFSFSAINPDNIIVTSNSGEDLLQKLLTEVISGLTTPFFNQLYACSVHVSSEAWLLVTSPLPCMRCFFYKHYVSQDPLYMTQTIVLQCRNILRTPQMNTPVGSFVTLLYALWPQNKLVVCPWQQKWGTRGLTHKS